MQGDYQIKITSGSLKYVKWKWTEEQCKRKNNLFNHLLVPMVKYVRVFTGYWEKTRGTEFRSLTLPQSSVKENGPP
jgi:hypothetical protein